MAQGAMDLCLKVLTESKKSTFDSYIVRNSVLTISQLPFGIVACTFFSDIIIIGRLQSRRLRASSSHNGPVPIQTIFLGQSCCLCLPKDVECIRETGSLPSWFSLPMWWNIQCVLLAWLIIRHPEYMAQKPQLAGSNIFY